MRLNELPNGEPRITQYYTAQVTINVTLTKEEAAFLSAMIPSPLNVFNPVKNRKRVVRRQRVILKGMNYIRLNY